MGKLRRGGFVFLSWTGDHAPRHAHAYRNGRLVLKWDLERGTAMRGQATARLLRLIRQLEAEGRL